MIRALNNTSRIPPKLEHDIAPAPGWYFLNPNSPAFHLAVLVELLLREMQPQIGEECAEELRKMKARHAAEQAESRRRVELEEQEQRHGLSLCNPRNN